MLRSLSTTSRPARIPVPRRAMLYVPGSNSRMMQKSLVSPADSVCYDLEDAVAPGSKVEARRAVCELLNASNLRLLKARYGGCPSADIVRATIDRKAR